MLTARTLDKYNVRMNVDDATIVLSTYDMHGNLNGVKVVYPFIYEKQNESHRDSNSRTNKDSSTENDTYVKKRVTRTTPRYIFNMKLISYPDCGTYLFSLYK